MKKSRLLSEQLFAFLYTIVLHGYFLIFLPRAMWLWWRRGGIGNILKGKFGITASYRAHGDTRPVIWVHAVSLGEVRGVAPLLKELRAHGYILLSTMTHTGYEEAKRQKIADQVIYLPLDLPYLIRPFVRHWRPNLVLLMETDFWYHFLDESLRCGAKLFLVNGKISSRSFHRYYRWRFLVAPLLGKFTHYYLQDELYAQRFQTLGLSPANMTVTGNLKLARGTPPRCDLPDSPPSTLVVALGSTHPPEEELWLRALRGLDVHVYLAPRHPERFAEVAAMLESLHIRYGRISKGDTFLSHPVLLVDQMGILCDCYQKSHVAFVGGTLTAHVGGHNLVEPSFYGIPVLYGPHTWGQPDLHTLLVRFQAGQEVTPETLRSTIQGVIPAWQDWKQKGIQGQRIFIEATTGLRALFVGIKQHLC